MNLRHHTLAVTVAGALTATTLTSAPAIATAPMGERPETYRQSDSGDRVSVDRGDVIRVVLKAAGGTGYTWRARGSSHVYTVVSRRESSTNPGVPGGGVKVVFTLKATERGTDTFRAQLRRSFGEDRVARRFSLTLKVS